MIKHNQDGKVSAVMVSLSVAILLLVITISFGGWAFASREDYKDNTDQKIADAVTIAKQKEDSVKDVAFAEAEKNPLRTYKGPETAGSLVVQYPKTWSGYVNDTSQGSALVDGYFYPGIVPSLSDPASVFALRMRVVSQNYTNEVASLAGQQKSGKVTVAAYALPKVPKTVGIKAVGTFNNIAGEMVLLPLRNQTIEISTQGTQFTDDFEKLILPNVTFIP